MGGYEAMTFLRGNLTMFQIEKPPAGADPGLTVGGCSGYLGLHCALARAKFYVPHPLLALFPYAYACACACTCL